MFKQPQQTPSMMQNTETGKMFFPLIQGFKLMRANTKLEVIHGIKVVLFKNLTFSL